MRPVDPDCIFCKIVAGEIPAQIVYRDESLLAFLDINPVSRGHTLLIPTAHVAELSNAAPEHLEGLASVLPRLAAAVKAAAGADGLNVLLNVGRCAGQLVPHAHFHLIPRRESETVKLVNWNPTEPSQDELAELRNRIECTLG